MNTNHVKCKCCSKWITTKDGNKVNLEHVKMIYCEGYNSGSAKLFIVQAQLTGYKFITLNEFYNKEHALKYIEEITCA